jgi:hypothetical protein
MNVLNSSWRKIAFVQRGVHAAHPPPDQAGKVNPHESDVPEVVGKGRNTQSLCSTSYPSLMKGAHKLADLFVTLPLRMVADNMRRELEGRVPVFGFEHGVRRHMVEISGGVTDGRQAVAAQVAKRQ